MNCPDLNGRFMIARSLVPWYIFDTFLMSPSIVSICCVTLFMSAFIWRYSIAFGFLSTAYTFWLFVFLAISIAKGPTPANMSKTISPGCICFAIISLSLASLGVKNTSFMSRRYFTPCSLCTVSVFGFPAISLCSLVLSSPCTFVFGLYTASRFLCTFISAFPIRFCFSISGSGISTIAMSPIMSNDEGTFFISCVVRCGFR